ncbi:hypothetical protein F8O01_03345 [Pseudoclavibacter chungangensis]|uniref:Multidrug ABC transporter ATPase n=1 Tax=Pseudoclavibacter chungangensis TaxID=587635 RepID=A0A7J5C0F2_9MICO|nr:hypothetical protein [Pseudoclavibacter chungangensis]KAB1660371.1 hypothetical protein F8O01_03345 [Pseudoclavibacter chungangensis]NYJ65732.1 TRAP-type C4-dicarboxylate transport system permease small subunit [Pseudoclavibacter chungangensis]
MSTPARAPISKVERIIAFMALGIAVIAFVALIVVVGAPLAGVPGDAMTTPLWQTLFLVAYFGLPIAFVLMLTLVIIRIVSNRRHRTDDR